MIENEQQYYSTKIKALEFEKTLRNLEDDVEDKKKEDILLFDTHISSMKNKLEDLREEINKYEFSRDRNKNFTSDSSNKTLDSNKDSKTFRENIQFFASKEIIGLSLIFGGAILLVYFYGIHYMPELEVVSIPIYLGAAAIVGLIFYIFVCYVQVLPGIVFRSFLDVEKDLIYLWNKKKQLPLFTFTFLLSVFLVPVSVAFICFYTSLWNIFKFALILFTLAIEFFVYKYLCEGKFYLSKFALLLFFSSYISLVACMPLVIIVLIVFLNPQSRISSESAWLVFFASSAVILVVNEFTLIDLPFKSSSSSLWTFKAYKFIFLPIISFSFVTASFNSFVDIPGFVVETFGWGNIKNASLIMNYDGCQSVKQIDKKILREECVKTKNFYRIDDLQILSTIGKSYFLRFPNEPLKVKSGNKIFPTLPQKIKYLDFTIPSSYIKSWSRK